MKIIYSFLLLMISLNLIAQDTTEIINGKTVVTSPVEVHARVVPIFNVTQNEALNFDKILSGSAAEQDQIITITDEYNAPIQFIFPEESLIETNDGNTITINLSSPEEITKIMNTNGSRDIIIRGTIANNNTEDGDYEDNATFKIKYD
ncbi:MAG: hypothetical protein WCR79_07320 [Fusobacterium sp.]